MSSSNDVKDSGDSVEQNTSRLAEDQEDHTDEEEDEDIVDPFSHSLTLTKTEWAKTFIFGIILIPIRLVIILTLMSIVWMVSSITLRIVNRGEKVKTEVPRPPGRRRRMGLRFIAFLGRVLYRSIGMNVVIKGDLAMPKEAPILVFAPHSSFYDVLIWCWCATFTGPFISPPYVVSRAENKKIPLFGNIFKLLRSLDVSREDPNSRRNTISEIIRRAEPVPDANPRARWPQLILSPEGTTSNGKVLVRFKPGAFIPGKPIQPILIRYPNKINTVTWTWNQTHGAMTVFFTTLAQPYTTIEIEFLSIYHPNADEIEDPKHYANNVRQHMANALKVPTSDLTFAEAKEKYEKISKRKKSIKEKKKDN